MRLHSLHFLFSFLAALGSASVRAEFPPDTFPQDPPDAAPGKDAPSYEESETKAAEDEYLAPRKRRQPPATPAARPSPKRRPRDGVERQPVPSDELPVARSEFERRLSVSLTGGIALFSSANTTANAKIQQAQLSTQLALGLMADFQFLKHFGVDLDGYYTPSANQPVILTSGGPTYNLQLVETGLLVGLRAELPLPQGDITWRPRLMLGYGMMNSAQTTVTPSGTASEGIQVTGIYLGGGLEMTYGKQFTAYADYSTSINTSGTHTTGGVGGNTSVAASPSGFSRLRLGANMKVFGPLWCGGLIMLRGQGAGVAADVAAARLIGETEQMLHFMAVASLSF